MMDVIAEAKRLLEAPDAELREWALKGNEAALEVLIARARMEEVRDATARMIAAIQRVVGKREA